MSSTARSDRRSLRPRSAPRRARRRALGPVLAVVLMLGCTMVLAAVGAAPAGASTEACRTVPAGSIRVVVVVDSGESSPVTTCMVVPDGITGSRLLAARAAELGAAGPSYAGSGLLCTIDGFPSSGCSETGAGSYWANFSGTSGSWVYSSYNPFIRHLHDGDIEGWRYVVRGTGAAGDAAPRVAPDAALFPPFVVGTQQVTTPDAGGGSGAAPSGDAGTTSSRDTDGVYAAGTATDGGSDPATSSAAGGTGASIGSGSAESRALDLAGAAPASSSGSGGAPWLGAALVLVLIAGLGAGAVFRSRRRA